MRHFYSRTFLFFLFLIMKDVYHLQVEAVCIMSFCLRSVSTKTASEPELWVRISRLSKQTTSREGSREQAGKGVGVAEDYKLSQ